MSKKQKTIRRIRRKYFSTNVSADGFFQPHPRRSVLRGR